MTSWRQRLALLGVATTGIGAVALFWLATRLPVLVAGDLAAAVAVVPFVIGMLTLAATGWLLVRRQERSRMGWLLLGTGLAGVLARLSLAVAVLAHQHGHGFAPLLGWTTNWSWLPAQLLGLLMLLHFPDGRLPSPRWRPLQWLVLGWSAITVAITSVLPGPVGAAVLAPMTNPLGLDLPGAEEALTASLDLIFLVQPVLLALVVAAPVLRWRNASAPERRQLTAVGYALLLLVVSAPLARLSGAWEVLEGLAWLVLPGTIAWVAGRDGTWDLDLRRRLDRLREVREEERSRLQRDLHDSLGPLLGSISMRTEAARNLLDSGATRVQVDDVLTAIGNHADTALVEVRRLIDELGPSALDDADLAAALAELVRGYADTGLRLTLSLPPDMPSLDAGCEGALYRVASEAVRNAVRHAAADECRVQVRVEGGRPEADWVVLSVVDDGVGLRGRPPGVGRRTMAERIAGVGGSFRLDAAPGGGVQVTARLPVRSSVPASARVRRRAAGPMGASA